MKGGLYLDPFYNNISGGGQPPRFCIVTLLQVKLIKYFANVYRSICLQYDGELPIV